jgi:glutamate formiminotransferase
VALSAAAAERIDLTSHRGIHPRFGCLDVCPFVPLSTEMDEAVEASLDTAHRIARDLEIPVFLYGSAASPGRPNELPDVRRAIAEGLDPDLGPPGDPRTGVVCVGARDVLIAFNVWVRCEVATARQIATAIRARDGGLQGVRALGLELEPHMCQISTNITLPEACGIDEVYSAISNLATQSRVEVTATEIVGLVPERFLPNQDEEAARRLMSPGRSLESVLAL